MASSSPYGPMLLMSGLEMVCRLGTLKYRNIVFRTPNRIYGPQGVRFKHMIRHFNACSRRPGNRQK